MISEKAITHFKEHNYPINLGEGKYPVLRRMIFYWLGCAFANLNQIKTPKNFGIKLLKAAVSRCLHCIIMINNRIKSFYQGLGITKAG
jgi:hypothetical protein